MLYRKSRSDLMLPDDGFTPSGLCDMLTVNNLVGFGAGPGVAKNPTMISIITDASLTSNLVWCGDPGDGSSYTSGQDWLDTSSEGNADEVHRGTGTGADSADPTFAGTANSRDIDTYFTLDGGDCFTYGASNPAWANTFHKDNAEVSILAAVYFKAGSAGQFIFSTGVSINDHGWNLGWGSGETLYVEVLRGSSPATFTKTIEPGTFTDGEWTIFGMSLDEAGGGVSFFYQDGDYWGSTFDAAYTNPSTSAATYPFTLGSRSAANGAMNNLTRIGPIAIWDTALSKANFDSIQSVLAPRFGL
jgi:hypothetical protein